ncbi:MAG: hypothetical protein ACD_9C00260G0005, partial [uncultured bacterium]
MKNKNEIQFPLGMKIDFEALGTNVGVEIVVSDKDQIVLAEKNFKDIISLYAEFENIFSRFDSKSELSELNSRIGKFNLASLHMRKIASLSLIYNEKTEGRYDPRILNDLEKFGYAEDFKTGVRKKGESLDSTLESCCKGLKHDLKIKEDSVFFGCRMDFSGIAKGYITDQIVEFLDNHGWKNFLIDSGGD